MPLQTTYEEFSYFSVHGHDSSLAIYSRVLGLHNLNSRGSLLQPLEKVLGCTKTPNENDGLGIVRTDSEHGLIRTWFSYLDRISCLIHSESLIRHQPLDSTQNRVEDGLHVKAAAHYQIISFSRRHPAYLSIY